MVEKTEKFSFRRRLASWAESDFVWQLKQSRVAMASLITIVVIIGLAIGAPWIAPQNPFDLGSIDITMANLPPSWMPEGDAAYLLGTDDQGRDLFSAILYGLRLSLGIGALSVFLAIVIGVCMGLLAGFVGGWLDALIMRLCDVMLSFPAILIALLLDGILKAVFAGAMSEELSYFVLVLAITLSGWVKYARTVRGLTLVEKQKEYVLAARVIGVSQWRIMLGHVLPNVLGPVFVLATVGVATAIMAESTLSFLGVGVPPTTPSLGTLIRIGNDYLFSGEWWVTVFPGTMLIVLVVVVNLFGDWVRDALNPKLQS